MAGRKEGSEGGKMEEEARGTRKRYLVASIDDFH
jgi:hypothetical protein